MRCEQVVEHLSAYADNEATSDEAAIVENHIAVCSECAEYLRFITIASSVFSSLPEVEPPVSMHAAILAATIHRPTWQERMRSALAGVLTPANFRYGAFAGSAAAAAWLAIRIAAPMNDIAGTGPAAVGGPRDGSSDATATTTTLAASDPSMLFTGSLNSLAAPSPQPRPRASASVATTRETAVQPARPARQAPFQIAKATLAKPRRSRQTVLAAARYADTAKTKAFLPADSGDRDFVEPSDVLPAEPSQPSGMRTAEVETGNSVAAAQPSAANGVKPSAQPVHIALASYSEPAASTQLVTLADLKRSLRRQAMDERSRFINESINEKKIRFDVVRSRF